MREVVAHGDHADRLVESDLRRGEPPQLVQLGDGHWQHRAVIEHGAELLEYLGERREIDLKEYNIPSDGSYIVGVKKFGDKQDLLFELSDSFEGWKPTYDYSAMSMFAGSLSGEQVAWLTEDARVAYVECDGESWFLTFTRSAPLSLTHRFSPGEQATCG